MAIFRVLRNVLRHVIRLLHVFIVYSTFFFVPRFFLQFLHYSSHPEEARAFR